MQCHLGGEFGRLDQFEEGIFLFQLAVFRQCATGLAHEPDRRTVHGAPMAGIKKSLAIRQRARGGSGLLVGGNGCHVPNHTPARNHRRACFVLAARFDFIRHTAAGKPAHATPEIRQKARRLLLYDLDRVGVGVVGQFVTVRHGGNFGEELGIISCKSFG